MPLLFTITPPPHAPKPSSHPRKLLKYIFCSKDYLSYHFKSIFFFLSRRKRFRLTNFDTLIRRCGRGSWCPVTLHLQPTPTLSLIHSRTESAGMASSNLDFLSTASRFRRCEITRPSPALNSRSDEIGGWRWQQKWFWVGKGRPGWWFLLMGGCNHLCNGGGWLAFEKNISYLWFGDREVLYITRWYHKYTRVLADFKYTLRIDFKRWFFISDTSLQFT